MKAAVAEQFDQYGRYHQHVGNRLAHIIGFPLIAVGVLSLTQAGLGSTGALVAQGLFAVVNVTTSRRLGLICTVVVLGLWGIAVALPIAVGVVCLSVGVGAPVLTHVLLEKRWPATLAQFLAFERVGHLWFLGRWLDLTP